MILARFLHEFGMEHAFSLVSFGGGQKDNAIPRQAEAEILLEQEELQELKLFAEIFTEKMRIEYTGTDEGRFF